VKLPWDRKTGSQTEEPPGSAAGTDATGASQGTTESDAEDRGDDVVPHAPLPVHRRHGLDDGLPGLAQLMDRLLAEDGCPWDREQTLDSLRPFLLEETYEVLEAMDDPRSHQEELGDLLFQIVFAAALREREEQFDLQDVIAGIRDKLIRRHPHVFDRKPGDPPSTRAEITATWRAIKKAEKAERGKDPDDPLADISPKLPAIIRAMRLQHAASKVGFDWPDLQGAVDKFREEWVEFEEAHSCGTREQLEDEYGDLLFVLIRIGQKLGLDAEASLRRANRKFERRFGHVVQGCRDRGIPLAEAGLARLESLWQEAKQAERAETDSASGGEGEPPGGRT
jgi:MazG family protein